MPSLEQRGLVTLTALSNLRPSVRPHPTNSTNPMRPQPNIMTGALIVSPAAVRDKMNQVNTQVASLDAEIKTNVTRPQFLSTWEQFRNNWQKFYTDHQSLPTILLTGTGTLDRKSNEYQAQLGTWYAALKEENPAARLVFPAPLPPTAPPTGASVPWWGISLLTALGTAALGYVTYATYVYLRDAYTSKRRLEEDIIPAVLEARGVPREITRSKTTTRRLQRDDALGDWDDDAPSRDRDFPLPPGMFDNRERDE